MEQGFSGDDFERRFTWQYFNDLGHSTLFIAEAGGRAVGITGLELRELSNGWLSGAVIDVAVAADWRKRGVMREIMTSVESVARSRGLRLLTSVVNGPGAAAIAHLKGWLVLAKIPLLRYSLEVAAPDTRRSGGLSPEQGPSVGFARNEAYRSWRFRNHPYYEYRRITTSEGVEAEVKVFQPARTGDIVDVFGDTGDPCALERAYKAATAALGQMGASEVQTWGILPAKELDVLHRLGWIRDSSQERSFAMNALSSEALILQDANRWRLQPADIEHY